MKKESHLVVALTVYFGLFSFAVNIFGQDSLSITKNLRTTQGNRSKSQTVVLPRSLEKELDKLLLSSPRRVPPIGQSLNGIRRGAISLLEVSQYFETRPIKTKSGISNRIVSHPSFYPALSSEGTLYVFSKSDIKADAEIFNVFQKEVGLTVRNETAALEFACFYIAASQGFYEGMGKFPLTSVDDIPAYYRNANEKEANRLREFVASPTTKIKNDGYGVEFYTWEAAGGQVRQWNIEYRLIGQMNVESKIIGKL